MLKLYVKELLRIKGYDAAQKDLMRKGFGRFHARKLLGEDVIHVKVEHIFHLCVLLNCTPNDLFCFVPKKSDRLPKDHALWKLEKQAGSIRPSEYLKSLSQEELAEVSKFLKNKKTI